MKKTGKKARKSVNKTVDLVRGFTAVAAAAAIARTYFLCGAKSAPKHRKQVKAWSLKAHGKAARTA